MDIGAIFFAVFFGGAAMTMAGGTIWLGARFLKHRENSTYAFKETIEHMENQIEDLQERLDFHDRLLSQRSVDRHETTPV